MSLVEKIKTKKANIGIIGLGYVGLPLVIEFCKIGRFLDMTPRYSIQVGLKKAGAWYILGVK